MPVYNIIAYSHIYPEISEVYDRDDWALENNNNIIYFPADNNRSISFKLKKNRKRKKRWHTWCWKMTTLKNLSHFCRTPEVPLINCEISHTKLGQKKSLLTPDTAANREPTFTITDTNLDIPVVTLSTQDNVKLLKQLESGFKRTLGINVNLK